MPQLNVILRRIFPVREKALLLAIVPDIRTLVNILQYCGHGKKKETDIRNINY